MEGRGWEWGEWMDGLDWGRTGGICAVGFRKGRERGRGGEDNLTTMELWGLNSARHCGGHSRWMDGYQYAH